MIGSCKFSFKEIDEVREELIGLKITDIEEKGKVIYLEDAEGRPYTLDTTGTNGVLVHAGLTDKEKIEHLETLINGIIDALDIEEKVLEEICESDD